MKQDTKDVNLNVSGETSRVNHNNVASHNTGETEHRKLDKNTEQDKKSNSQKTKPIRRRHDIL